MSYPYKCPQCKDVEMKIREDIKTNDWWECLQCKATFHLDYIAGFWKGYNEANKALKRNGKKTPSA